MGSKICALPPKSTKNKDDVECWKMLANYTFKDGVPKKLGDPGIPTIPCSIKKNYVKTAFVI